MLQILHERLHEMGYQPISRYKVDSFIIDYYEIWINNLYYGSNSNYIQINSGDSVRFEITKKDDALESKLSFENILV